MPGDFTKKTIDPKRRFGGVTMQQGRVKVDADLDEAAVIENRRAAAARSAATAQPPSTDADDSEESE